MRRVTTISLNGNAYQIDEAGYAALQSYLGAAEQRLAGSPDRAEILADLEQAIAEKCGRFLGPHKNVVSVEEITEVIREMGPVEPAAAQGPAATVDATPAADAPDAAPDASQGGDAGAAGSNAAGSGQASGEGGTAAPKRLYQIREGAMISGVCNGIAAYLGMDVTLVRIAFVLLALITWGAWILVYGVLMFVIPYATTSEQHAAAHGWAFNAQELIERAKQQLRDGEHWRQQKRQWREQRRQWRHQWRLWHAQRRWGVPPRWAAPFPNRPADASYATQLLAGLLIPIAALLGMVLLFGLILAIISVLRTHTLFGWELPADVPQWAAIGVLVLLYAFIVSPLHALHRVSHYAHGGLAATVGGLLWAGLLVVCLWAAWRHWPEVQQFLQQLRHPAAVATQLTWLR
ncbi:MAG TPA: PspC domain-containing protein [Steroidobacteraceae bacterium]|nr:PspC domain-containing protein [Steroidobacteraceae bacterium]